MRNIILAINLLAWLWGCQMNGPGASEASVLQVSSDTLSYQLNIPAKEVLYDKVLGSLVGSAIGDAMGAPTEMWTREDRQSSYGSVEALEPSAIDPSPEGIWDFHLPTGTTTDDTRWKSLVGNYLADNINNFYQPSGPDPYSFANHILNAYRDEVNQLRNISPNDPVDIEYKVRRLNWLQEWAMVAEPFAAKDLEGYTTSLHRFYGGDLLCAGMLYAPIIGLPYPGNPYQAYNAAHRLGIFDQGYARDITGLTAAMVAAAMLGDATPVSILEVFRTIDPHNYFRSRIFGREAFKTLRTAEYIAQSAKKLKQCNDVKPVYQWAKDSVKSCQIQTAFEMLDQRNQISPAHAQEILLVTLTSILFSDFDFRESMEFIVNYGRDNDTSGAVAGAILGAYLGYEQLPDDLKLNVVETNRENLGIDLQQLAATITDKITSARLYN